MKTRAKQSEPSAGPANRQATRPAAVFAAGVIVLMVSVALARASTPGENERTYIEE